MNTAAEPTFADTAAASATLLRGGVDVIDALAHDWRALCEASPYDEPFYRPEWVRAYVEAFAPDAQVLIVTVRTRGRLVAVLPLIKETGTIGGLPARKLRSASNTHSCRYHLVHDAAHAADAIRAVWSALCQEPGWDALEFTDVPRDGALMRLVALADADGCQSHVAPSLSPPYLDLQPFEGDHERLLERTTAKFRSNVRRRMRKLQTHGRVSLVHSGETRARLDQFLQLEGRGWKGAEHSAIGSGPATRAFYAAVAAAAERLGALSWYVLELDGRPIAMFYGVYHRGRYYLLKTTYDETLSDCSPGQLLTHEALRALLARGCVEFDFLGGVMDWKRDWAPSLRQLNHVYVFRGAAGRALHALRFRLRPAVARAVRRMRAAS